MKRQERWERLKLIVIKGADEGKQFDLSDTLVGVGRDAVNQIRLHDTEISRRHAEFYRCPQGYRLRDIGSANGTYVNNQPITDVLLNSGDQIQIGQSLLVYTGSRNDNGTGSDLADRISLITRQDVELSSAIVKTIGETEGSRILARPEKVERPWLKTALANLGIMYETIQATSHILDLNQLLEKIMELIFRSLEADRGCIMLRNPDSGQFQPKAVRWRSGPPLPEEKFPVSRTIMEYVLREKQGILVSDAAQDDRFKTQQSIVRFGIREVICVPMKGRHDTLGVLYLDTHTVPREFLHSVGDIDATHTGAPDEPVIGKFTEDHLALAIAIAHQAALAVEETRYRDALVQSERLAAIGQTVAALSHHIKNILQGLITGGEILKVGLTEKDFPTLEQGWRIVEKNQGKIYDLVMDMLSYSKEREPAIKDTDVNRIVQEVVELMQRRAQSKNIRLETRLGELPICQIDREGIHRALLNVVSNAFDAVEERTNPHVAIGTLLEADNEWVRILVLDNGVGIPAETLPEIFKPFLSTKGSRGTGLGLAVSRKILREHGGDILVKSNVGKGSHFILRFPVRSPLAADVMGTVTHQILPTEE